MWTWEEEIMSTGGQTMFINHEYINEVLEKGKESNREEILKILEKAE